VVSAVNTGAQRCTSVPLPVAFEHHFSVDEIAELWGLSRDSVIRIFEREPGVVIVQTPKGNRGRRGYRTLRIPESVALRVHRRMSIAA
jgi:transcriptional regulator GlxA family with amidase domain